jgi:hypothetical protein
MKIGPGAAHQAAGKTGSGSQVYPHFLSRRRELIQRGPASCGAVHPRAESARHIIAN